MPANFRDYIVFDYETDGKLLDDPATPVSPVQISAVAIHGKKLTIKPNSEFNMFIRPPGIDKDEYFTDARMETIKWHAGLKHNQCKPEDIIERWKSYPDTKMVWSSWLEYVDRHNYTKKFWHAPIPVGANIIGYDLPITDEMDKKLKMTMKFWRRDARCVQSMIYPWTESLTEGPENLKVETLANWLGIDIKAMGLGAHEAMTDVKICAEIFIKLMKLHRACVEKVPYFRERR